MPEVSHNAGFVTLGETMIRETPADQQRLETSRMAYWALGGSEFSIAVMLARLGVPSRYVTRVPANPLGWMLRDGARAHGVDAAHFVWADAAENMGRYLYEPGVPPRAGRVWYQRQHSAASRLGRGMVDWAAALDGAHLLHTSGITFGLAAHSGYASNPPLEAFEEAIAARPSGCAVGIEFNYRATLWSAEAARQVMTPILEQHADILVTSIYDMAQHYGIGCGHYDAAAVLGGGAADLHDDDLSAFGVEVARRFDLRLVAVNLRREITADQHLWESAAIDRTGHVVRSAAARPVTIVDRLGGGDAWTGGFYSSLLTHWLQNGISDDASALDAGMRLGVATGDAAARLQQTIHFDLPIVSREEIDALIAADARGETRTRPVR